MAKVFPAAILACLWLAGLAAGGCNGPGARPGLKAGFESEDPADRIAAIRQASANNDTSALPALVTCLNDSESDVRLFAIMALKKLTGQDMGYRHWDSPPARQEAIARWQAYLRDRAVQRK